jgi:hypothetical protein
VLLGGRHLLGCFPGERDKHASRGWRPTSPGAAVPGALPDPVARGRVAGRLDLAALQAGNGPIQALPPPIDVQQGLGLVEDPVVFGVGKVDHLELGGGLGAVFR